MPCAHGKMGPCDRCDLQRAQGRALELDDEVHKLRAQLKKRRSRHLADVKKHDAELADLRERCAREVETCIKAAGWTVEQIAKEVRAVPLRVTK